MFIVDAESPRFCGPYPHGMIDASLHGIVQIFPRPGGKGPPEAVIWVFNFLPGAARKGTEKCARARGIGVG